MHVISPPVRMPVVINRIPLPRDCRIRGFKVGFAVLTLCRLRRNSRHARGLFWTRRAAPGYAAGLRLSAGL